MLTQQNNNSSKQQPMTTPTGAAADQVSLTPPAQLADAADTSSVNSDDADSLAKMGTAADDDHSSTDHDQVVLRETTAPTTIPIRIFVYLMCLGVGVVYLTLFSGSRLGYGSAVYRTLSEQYGWAYYTGFGSVGFAVTLFCADVRYWHGSWAWFARVLVIACVLGFAITALLLTREYPAAPIAIYLLFVPFGFGAVKHVLLKKQSVPVFLAVLMRALLVMSALSVAYFVYELVALGRYWNPEVKLELYAAVRCNTTALEGECISVCI
jgi:hypothetical protein